MDVAAFQEKLQALYEAALTQNNRLTGAQVSQYFNAEDLDREQLIRILQYFRSKGIEIDTDDKETDAVDGDAREDIGTVIYPGTRTPLTADDEAFLQEYLEPFEAGGNGESTLSSLFLSMSMGDSASREKLIYYYMPVIGRLCAEQNSGEILLADLIQEVNVGMLSFLSEKDAEVRDDAWVRKKIQEEIIRVLTEQTEQKILDDSLVSKVEKLDEAVRELTDEEDKQLKFTVDELAVILDMKVDEIRDILRLTGDDSPSTEE